MSQQPEPTSEEHAAITRLWRVAKTDTGQARRVADFLLAWWNAEDATVTGARRL